MEALPLYQQIYSDLLEKIRDGTYLENKSLPAERVLCQMYHVSRSTIRRTLDELQKEGYIVKAQGNGNFVKPKVFDQKLTKVHSFASSLKEQHILIKNQILDYELVEGDKYLESLDIVRQRTPPGSRWHKLTRLRSAEAFPLMIETSYLLQSRFLALKPEVLRTVRFTPILRRIMAWRSQMRTRRCRLYCRQRRRGCCCRSRRTYRACSVSGSAMSRST